jgi:hypothetical protein
MEGGIPLRVFVARNAAAPIAMDQPTTTTTTTYTPVAVEEHAHGGDPTWVSERTWRLGVITAAVLVGLFLLAVGVVVFVGYANDVAAATAAGRGSGFANKCSSSGLFSAVFAKCKVIKRLPLVVAENGACYRLASDLVWAGVSDDGPAIEWSGNRGELHGCGHRLLITDQSGEGILVRGLTGDDSDNAVPSNGVGGELTVYDLFLDAPTQKYSAYHGFGIVARNGATLELEDVVFRNYLTSVFITTATLRARRVNITTNPSLDDPNRAAAWDDNNWFFDGWGISCWGGSNCVLEDYTFYSTDDSAAGDYRQVPYSLQTVGFQCGYNDFPPFDGPPFCTLERAQITAHQGVWFSDASAFTLRDAQIMVLPGAPNLFDTTFWGDIENPLYSPRGQNYGVLVNYGTIVDDLEHQSSALLERVTVDTHLLNNWTQLNAGIFVSSGSGMTLREVTVYGVAPRAGWYTVAEFMPGYTTLQYGLLAIDPYGYIFDSTMPVQVIDSTFKAIEYGTATVTIAVAPLETGSTVRCSTVTTMVTFDGCSFVSTDVGVLVGTLTDYLTSIENSRFSKGYYGLYAAFESRNVRVRSSTFSRFCQAVYIEEDAQNVVLRDVDFLENHLDVNSSTTYDVVSVNTASAGEGASCTLGVPELYYVRDCVAPPPNTFDENPAQERYQQMLTLRPPQGARPAPRDGV